MMRFPAVGDKVIFGQGRFTITHWRDAKGRREYFSGGYRLGYLEEVMPMVVDLVLRPAQLKTTHRVTLDLPVRLHDAVEASCQRLEMSKAQFMRTALEVLNLLANEDGARFLVRKNERSTELFIPGISKGRKS